METIHNRLGKLGIEIPEILLPKKMNLKQWAVIACDQFTQDKNYWNQAGESAAGAPSTLNMIFPEAFLTDEDHAKKIEEINRNMRNYLDSGVFADPRRAFIYIERDTPFNRRRKGLVAAVDLEKYEWLPCRNACLHVWISAGVRRWNCPMFFCLLMMKQTACCRLLASMQKRVLPVTPLN
jgi:hypothetical protein